MKVQIEISTERALKTGKEARQKVIEISAQAIKEHDAIKFFDIVEKNGIDLKLTYILSDFLVNDTAEEIFKLIDKIIEREKTAKESLILNWLSKKDDEKIYLCRSFSNDSAIDYYSTFEETVFKSPKLQLNCRSSGRKYNNDGTTTYNYNALCDSTDQRVIAETERLRPILKQKIEELKKEIEKKKEESLKKEQAMLELKQRKQKQLAEIVEKLGTELQKEKYKEGLMKMSEIIKLEWNEVWKPLSDASFEVLKSEYHLEKKYNEDGEEIDRYNESEKRTLTDEQFEKVQQIKKIISDCTAEFYTQYYGAEFYTQYYSDGSNERFVLVRLSKKVGELELKCDIEL